MLSIEEKTLKERVVLGTFLEFPSMGKAYFNILSEENFSSEIRVAIYKHIRDEGSKGREIIREAMTGDNDMRHEIVVSMQLSSAVNIKGYIDDLLVDLALNRLWKMGEEIQEMVVNDKPLLNILKYTDKRLADIKPNDDRDFDMTMDEAIDIIDDTVHKEYHIGWKNIDIHLPFSSRSIWVIGGNEGTFKTKLMIYTMRLLLSKYDNISVLWYSMEDPADKIIRGFISQDLLMTDSQLKKVKYKKLIPDDVKGFDIQFKTKSCNIKQVGDSFIKFRSQREGRFCILIVDNLMKIVPSGRETDVDMEIVREVESWNIKTSMEEASVILLHHFVKGVTDDKNLKDAYEPKIADLRGSGRYKDMATGVLLVNPMYSHEKIKRLFNNYKDFINSYYIVHIAKNRDGSKHTMYMAAYPEFNHFYEIS